MKRTDALYLLPVFVQGSSEAKPSSLSGYVVVRLAYMVNHLQIKPRKIILTEHFCETALVGLQIVEPIM